MQKKLQYSVILLATMLISGCRLHPFATPTPLPGWRSPVYELLLDETSFPDDWQLGYDVPENAKEPTTNHVTKEWWQRFNSGTANQSIWRAYSVAEAQEKYEELIRTQYQPSRPISSTRLFVEFTQPPEINTENITADQFHLACGWWDKAYCLTVARYRNYVVLLWIDHQADFMGHTSNGMTYQEIERINWDMDTKFMQFLPQ